MKIPEIQGLEKKLKLAEQKIETLKEQISYYRTHWISPEEYRDKIENINEMLESEKQANESLTDLLEKCEGSADMTRKTA